MELPALRHVDDLQSLQVIPEVQMPPRTAQFTVGRDLQTCLGLLAHEVRDRGILDLLQFGFVNLTGRVAPTEEVTTEGWRKLPTMSAWYGARRLA